MTEEHTLKLLFSSGLIDEQVDQAIEDIRKAVEAAGGTLTVVEETE